MQGSNHIEEWLNLSDETRLRIFTETAMARGLLPIAVEKDWWVVQTLSLILTMNCARSLVFKGGTSLSKAWNLIERFSEDIDLSLDREYLGFSGELEHAAVRRLRKKSYDYLTKVFINELETKFMDAGLPEVKVQCREFRNHDQDPIVIEIYYRKLAEKETYLKPGILVEVGSRSLKEPYTNKSFASMVSENYPDQPFSDLPITVSTVNPERTLLEKIFLLHEELQRSDEKRRVGGLSRHLYDIEKLSRTEFVEVAFKSPDLYNTIVEHRRKFHRISGVNFDNHSPDKIDFIPPVHLVPAWRKDYDLMKENMIYGESLPFNELMERLRAFQDRIRTIRANQP